MSTNQIGTQPNPNKPLTILSAAKEILCTYPLVQIRKDMSIQEKITYNYEWNTFNTVWAYNYTVSTVNGLGGLTGIGANSPWQHINNKERIAYRRGQIFHVQAYPDAGAAGVFNNIVF